MKKVQLNNISEGVRYPLTTLFAQHIQEAYTEIVDALVKGLIEDPSKLTILHGCAIGGASPNYTVSAGAAYYQGEVFLVDAGTVNVPSGQTLVWRIEESYAAGDPVTFSDNIPRNAHLIRKMKLVAGASGSGVADNAEVKQLNILKSILDLDNAKANKQQSEWINMPGVNPHPSAIFGQDPNSIPPPAYMKDEMGFVHLRSVAEVSGIGNIFTLPVGYRPENTYNIGVLPGGNSSTKIWPDGRIVVDTDRAWFVMDGITFKAAQ